MMQFQISVILNFRFIVTGALVSLWLGCNQDSEFVAPKPAPKSKATEESDIKTKVDKFCGACHITPDPATFPKSAWYEEVQRGYNFYFVSDRNDLLPPLQSDVIAYYRNLAPEQLIIPLALENDSPSPIRIRHEVISNFAEDLDRDNTPAFSFLDWSAENDESFFISDMRRGIVGQIKIDGQSDFSIAEVSQNPVAIRVCDLDQNDQDDLVIADLGSFLPEDHDQGKVVWIRDYRTPDPVIENVLENVGRVADVRVSDFDGDGNDDLVVAEFGWHTTGGIHLLLNQGSTDDDPASVTFQATILDDRSGTIHVPTTDLDGDGRVDFIALISQEHEKIVAFLNKVDGFQKVELFQAPDPSFGSSGIELVDLDQDDDLDILYTNGDTFDSAIVKPYHGILWLENRGELNFVEHRLTQFPGVHRALAADIDGDGDMDIVSTSLLPHNVFQGQKISDFDSVIWLEQTTPGKFIRHSIERGLPFHSAMTLGDFDHDGDIDLAVSHFLQAKEANKDAVTLFWNEGSAPESPTTE